MILVAEGADWASGRICTVLCYLPALDENIMRKILWIIIIVVSIRNTNAETLPCRTLNLSVDGQSAEIYFSGDFPSGYVRANDGTIIGGSVWSSDETGSTKGSCLSSVCRLKYTTSGNSKRYRLTIIRKDKRSTLVVSAPYDLFEIWSQASEFGYRKLISLYNFDHSTGRVIQFKRSRSGNKFTWRTVDAGSYSNECPPGKAFER